MLILHFIQVSFFFLTFEQQFFYAAKYEAFFLFCLKRTYHVLLKGWAPTHKKIPCTHWPQCLPTFWTVYDSVVLVSTAVFSIIRKIHIRKQVHEKIPVQKQS